MTDKRMKRIICHWTAGGSRASNLDREHYHRLVEQDGTVVKGYKSVADNIVASDGDYAAHTLNLNTRSIGVSMCGMRDAIEYPFSPGPSPINEEQFLVFCRLIADLCREYSIPVTPKTVLTHAEVETNLGVKQRGKWDIAVLPWDRRLTGARVVGDHLRKTVTAMLGDKPAVPATRPAIRFGAMGVAVAELQTDLAALGYFSGRIDGDFGPLTRAALLAFQADQDLETDAVAGPLTWAALERAQPRPPRDITQAEIDAESGIAGDARIAQRVGDLVGIGGIAGIATQISTASDAVGAGLSGMQRLSDALLDNWPLVAVGLLCLFGWLALRALGVSIRRRRLRDAREHRSLSR